MPLSAIAGTFRLIGASPDGDSIRFYPTKKDAFTSAGLTGVRTNASGGAQLRLDAIDALETHYTPPGAPHAWHQPADLGAGASTALLSLLGFSNVQRDDRGIVTAATPKQRSGYILTRFADKYGRAVAFAYAGARKGGYAKPVHVGVSELRQSVNYQLLAKGWAYPTFYSKLYLDLRNDLAAAAVAARKAKKGVWKQDGTLAGFEVTSVDQLQDELVIMPKLFRRLAEYLVAEPGSASLAGFSAFLSAHNDRLFTVPAGQATALDTLVDVQGQSVRLSLPPEQIVFNEG
ncbi:MAG: thermonuclease family protein [Jatrophihabitantaceae bacterium]